MSDYYVKLPQTTGGGSSGVSSIDAITGAITLVAGPGISITDNSPLAGDITISNIGAGGTVTSVGLSTPGTIYSVSGSPVTTSGTLTLNLLTQSANTVFAGPTSGGAANPSFRSLVGADIPVDNNTIFVNGSNKVAVQYSIVNPSSNSYFFGNNAGNITNTGTGNTGFGDSTLTSVTSGINNSAFGENALTALTSGNTNQAFGYNAGSSITTGADNTAMGASAVGSVTTASYNTGIGHNALHQTTTSYNTGIGMLALYYNTTGSQNTAIGAQSAGTTVVTSTNMTFLGAFSTASVDGLTNSTAIGRGATVTASNQIMLGNSSVTSIATATPSVLYNSVSPMSTTGDTEYYNAGVQRLPVGTTGQLLTVVGGLPAWQTLSASSISGVITVPNGGTGLSSLTPYALIAGGAVSTSNAQQVSGTGTAGQLLMSNGAGALPTWQTPSITNGNPSGSQFLTSGTTFTTPSTVNAATQFKFTLVGGGGGGAGTSATANQVAAGGGGGAVGIVLINGLAASTAYTISIGSGGTGGAAGANAGGAGGDTTLIIGATTYTAGHGSGAAAGVSMDGGAGGTCLNTTLSINGGQGGSVGVAGTASVSGYGGAAAGYGSQTSGRITIGAGAAGTGYGAGGAGGKSVAATAEAGGNGAPGAILVEWYN